MSKRKRRHESEKKVYPRPAVPPVPVDAFQLRPDQLAKAGQVGLLRVYDLIHKGVIPAIKVGRHYRIPRAQFEALLAANPALFAAPPVPKKTAVGR